MTEQMAIEKRLPDEALKNAIGVYEPVVEATKDVDDEDYNPILDKVTIRFLNELQQYRAIGTVEILQALNEKSVAKKPRLIMNAMVCPSCPKVYSSDSVTYCTNCGQHLDWE